jgi:hypothetical protein
MCRFLDAGINDSPHAQPTAVQKAPRHEVAGSWARAGQQALWGLYERGHCQARFLGLLFHGTTAVPTYQGWPECGPFDAVIVTAALDHVPPPLIAQLRVGGRLVMPVCPLGFGQQLSVVEKLADGKTQTRLMGLVSFVPFTRSRK